MAALVDLDNFGTTMTSWLGKADGSTTGTGYIKTSATITASSFNATSALESKDNIESFDSDALKLINDIDIVKFNFKNDKEKNQKVGFIADYTNELFSTKNHDNMDLYNCIGILLKAVQELSNEVQELKAKLAK